MHEFQVLFLLKDLGSYNNINKNENIFSVMYDEDVFEKFENLSKVLVLTSAFLKYSTDKWALNCNIHPMFI